ncbi:hypothetical protein GAMM_320003 [Gammaproteobacteria bacterium]
MLFTLRQVDHNELVVTDSAIKAIVKRDDEQLKKVFTGDELSDLFGINVDVGAAKTQQSHKTNKAKTTKKIVAAKKLQKTKEKKSNVQSRKSHVKSKFKKRAK